MDNKASTLLCLLFRSPAVAPVQKQVAVLHLQAHQWLPLYIVRDRAHTGRDFCSIISLLSANNSQTPRAVCLYSLDRKCWRVQRWSFNSSLLSPCFFFPAFRDEFHLKSCHDSKKKKKKKQNINHMLIFPKPENLTNRKEAAMDDLRYLVLLEERDFLLFW